MIRILLIPSSDYLGHPFPQRHNHIFERIHDGKNFEVHVIRFNIFGEQRLSSKCVIHELSFELKTNSTPMYYLGNVIGYTSEIFKIIKQESIDIVVAGNLLPPLTYKLAEKLRERRIPFVYDLQDYYPISALGYITLNNNIFSITLKGLFELITQSLIRMSDVVTAPGVALAWYARKVGSRNVQIIPNGVSEHFLKRYDYFYVRNKLGFNERDFVVGYIGSVEFWLDIKPLISAVSTLKNRIQIKLLLIGKNLQSPYFRKTKKWLKEYGIEDITLWLDFIPHEEVPKYIAAMDIGTIPFNVNNLTAYYAAPNKLWEYLSQRTETISSPIPEAIIYRNFVWIAKNEREYISNIYNIFKGHTKISEEVSKIIRKRRWSNISNLYKKLIYNLVKKE